MPIKLLVISNYIHTVTVRPEAEIILQLQKTGQYDITVMTEAKAEYAQKFRDAGIRVIDFLPTKKFSMDYVRLIRKELKEGKYHVLQAFNNKAMVNSLVAAMDLPVKVVVYRGYTGNISWLDPLMYVKYLSPRVDRIVCLVEAIRQIFRKNLLFNKDKAVTINKGHDIHWYDGVTALDRTSLGIPADAFTFVCGANSRRMKGIKYLLQATYFLPADTRIHLMLAGKDMDVPLFKKLIAGSPIKKNIHLLGFRKDILEVVKSNDVFVLPSIKGEAITKSVIEAMSLGVCPLITDISGNKGLVINNVCGIVVESKNPRALADQMIFLSENPALAKQYGQAARTHIMNNFNTKDTAVKFDKLYQELYFELQGNR